MMVDELLSLEDAAQALLLSPRQLSELAKRGDISAAKVGRKWVFRPEFLREYVDRQTKPADFVRRVSMAELANESLDEDVVFGVPELDWGRRR